MAVGRGILTKIGSVKSTQKITSAMELVAASKMRKAQDRMYTSRPYADKLKQMIHHIAASHSEYRHPYLIPRADVKRVGYIVISTDRGLCGGLNINLFKSVLKEMSNWQQSGVEVELCVIGQRSLSYFQHLGANIQGSATHLGDRPSVQDLIGIVRVMLSRYNDSQIDQLHVAYNRLVNTMTQEPQIEQLLPLPVAVTQEAMID